MRPAFFYCSGLSFASFCNKVWPIIIGVSPMSYEIKRVFLTAFINYPVFFKALAPMLNGPRQFFEEIEMIGIIIHFTIIDHSRPNMLRRIDHDDVLHLRV